MGTYRLPEGNVEGMSSPVVPLLHPGREIMACGVVKRYAESIFVLTKPVASES